MRRWYAVVVSLALGGCSIDADYRGTAYRCAESQRCPGDLVCVDQVCVEPGAAEPDAAAPAIDADGEAFDAAPGADAAPVDFCEAAVDAPPADTCQDGEARDLTAAARAAGGVTVYGDTSTMANHLGTPASGCLGTTTAGPDAIYTLRPSAGERVTARLRAPDWNSALYLTDGCTTGVNCLDGDDNSYVPPTPQEPEEIVHTFSSTGVFYLVVDTTLTVTGCFALDVQLETL